MALAQQGENLPILYKNNLQVAWGSNTTLTVAAGQARNSENSSDMTLVDAVTVNAAINGANGLDTGSLAASTWYGLYEISSSLNLEQPAMILSTSLSGSIVKPQNYDIYTLVAYWLTDGSAHFIKGYVAGNGNLRQHYHDDSIKVLNDGTASTLTAIDLSTAVPPVQNTPVLVEVEFTPATADDKVSFFPGDSTATVGANISGVVAAKKQTGQLKVLSRLASSAAKIKYINSAASCNLDVWVSGFEYFV